MSDYDLSIRGGTITTASDTFRADIGVRNGRIVAIADQVTEAAHEIVASGLLVMPGGIDSHCHAISRRPAQWADLQPHFE